MGDNDRRLDAQLGLEIQRLYIGTADHTKRNWIRAEEQPNLHELQGWYQVYAAQVVVLAELRSISVPTVFIQTHVITKSYLVRRVSVNTAGFGAPT